MPKPSLDAERPIAVIGGGITGLSTAFELIEHGARVVLFEQSASLGGKIAETSLDGTVVPTGPDAFLARRPEVTELAGELGLIETIISPSARAARIYRDGLLHPLPPNVLGIPATLDLTATGLISNAGAAIAAAGVADDAGTNADESVGSLVRRQLGDEVLEFLVDPLLGGINAGDSDRLSIVSGVPQLDALRKRGMRLVDSAAATIEEAARNAVAAAPAPVFHSIDGGIKRLIDRLEQRLIESGLCTIYTEALAEVTRLDPYWSVNGVEVDQVISTIPAHSAAALVSDTAPEAATVLKNIEYSSVALTLLTLPPNAIELDPSISGVLVPRSLGHHVTAVSFASHKWPELAVGGRQVLRVSVGRRTDVRWLELTDDELVAIIEDDLSEIFGVEIEAVVSKVTRWIRSLPQYDVDHELRLQELDSTLEKTTGLHLTGAWRDGLGLPACVAAGRRAARKAIGA